MPADWDLLEEIYAFVKAREVERIDKATKKGAGREFIDRMKSHLRYLQDTYGLVKQHPTNTAAAAAIDVFRKAAMRDEGHPDYDPLWTMPTK